MIDKIKVRRHIDEGANFYLWALGAANHMEYIDNGIYSLIRPKEGQQGGTSLFQVRLDHLSDAELLEKVYEIKKLNYHTWWGLNLSERALNAVYGNQRPLPATETNEEEGQMALMVQNKPEYGMLDVSASVKKVTSAEDFKIWANICNKVLHGGYPIIHPENHYHLCKEDIMPCYIGYYNGVAASVCSILNHKEAASLEFVGTLEECRRKGLAKAVCITAIEQAFKNGSEIITLRALSNSKIMYKGMGFEFY